MLQGKTLDEVQAHFSATMLLNSLEEKIDCRTCKDMSWL